MAEFVQGIIEKTGYLGIFLFTLIENFFPPLPEEAVLPFAGYVSTQGKLSFWDIVVAGTLGATLGAYVWFSIARKVGEDQVRIWVGRHGKWLTLEPKHIDKLDELFRKHGNKAVFFCRLVPGLRTAVAIPAGLSGMNPAVFLAYYAGAAFLWTLALTGLGRILGERFERIGDYLSPILYIVIGLSVGYYLFRLLRPKRNETSSVHGQGS